MGCKRQINLSSKGGIRVKHYPNERSTVKPEPFSTDAYHVYIRTNIRQESFPGESGDVLEWVCDTEMYDKDEYITLISAQNAETARQLLNVQAAVCALDEEVYKV
jgi:hypothetical protein